MPSRTPILVSNRRAIFAPLSARPHKNKKYHLPALCLCLPALAQPRQRGFRRDGANPRSWGKTSRRPTRSHRYILVPHWQAHCLGSPAFGASPGPSASWVHTSVVNLAVSPPPGQRGGHSRRLVFCSARAAYTPPRYRLPTITQRPRGASFLPLLLSLLVGRSTVFHSLLLALYMLAPCITP